MKSLLVVLVAMMSLVVAAASSLSSARAADGKELWAFFGTYTNNGKSKGIYCHKLDLASGKLTSVGVTEGIKNPTFLAIHPTGKFLYAVSEVSDADGKPIKSDGSLEKAASAIQHEGSCVNPTRQSSPYALSLHYFTDNGDECAVNI